MKKTYLLLAIFASQATLASEKRELLDDCYDDKDLQVIKKQLSKPRRLKLPWRMHRGLINELSFRKQLISDRGLKDYTDPFGWAKLVSNGWHPDFTLPLLSVWKDGRHHGYILGSMHNMIPVMMHPDINILLSSQNRLVKECSFNTKTKTDFIKQGLLCEPSQNTSLSKFLEHTPLNVNWIRAAVLNFLSLPFEFSETEITPLGWLMFLRSNLQSEGIDAHLERYYDYLSFIKAIKHQIPYAKTHYETESLETEQVRKRIRGSEYFHDKAKPEYFYGHMQATYLLRYP